MKNVETPDKINLSNLITEIKKGNYVIPDFQREFEWEPWDVRDLIKSIFMDYYIGTLLLWKASKENVKSLNCTPLYAFDDKGKPQHIVLDGQQRLSAIHYAFFDHPNNYPRRKSKYFYFVNIADLLKENYDDAFNYQIESRRIRQLINEVLHKDAYLSYKNQYLKRKNVNEFIASCLWANQSGISEDRV